MLAFLPTLGFQEMVVLLVLGVLLFGRNLPDVGRSLGRTVAQLRRGMQEFKDQMGRDESLKELRDTVNQTRNEVARATALPRALANPGAALRSVARDALAEGEAAPPETAPPETAADTVAETPAACASTAHAAPFNPFRDGAASASRAHGGEHADDEAPADGGGSSTPTAPRDDDGRPS